MTDKQKVVLPYGTQGASKKQEVATMFDNISPRYDLLNRVLSLGIDIYWRKVAIAQLKGKPIAHLLDMATGTADLAMEALSLNPGHITGLDISEGMLSLGREKLKKKGLDHRIELLQGDAEHIPFGDGTFDAAMVAFGVRNFENLEKGLAEMYRVLQPGAKLVVLEFSKPTVFPVKQLYAFYSGVVLPAIGRMLSGDARAYTYLPESVAAFPAGQAFEAVLRQVGFGSAASKPLTFGIVSVYIATK